MRIAINGAGVAGPALAYWLHRSGHEPTLIEKTPHFRTGGYVIDFWGVGYTVAERMGILPDILEAGYLFQALLLLDEHGRKVGGFPTDAFQRIANGRFTSLPRGDLAAIIYHTIAHQIPTFFGTSISAIEQHENGVHVTLDDGSVHDFDLVVGADGLHSKVRQLVFGPEAPFEKQLGYRVATFETEGYRPRDELTYVAHGVPGRQIARIALRDDRTVFLFVFRAEFMTREEPSTVAEKRAVLHDVFGDMGWECPQILAALDTVDDVYFDRVSQIRMQSWSTGRVILIGDAAAAVSLLAGEGTGLAMTEAYVLAGELNRAQGDYRVAFDSYEKLLRPFIEGKQKAAEGFAASFIPRTGVGLWIRNQVTRLMNLPGIADWLMSRMVSLRDDFDLPEYRM